VHLQLARCKLLKIRQDGSALSNLFILYSKQKHKLECGGSPSYAVESAHIIFKFFSPEINC
jgi:hypothetical protein